MRETLEKLECSLPTTAVTATRPRVEYATPAWAPYEKQHIASIKAVQRSALTFVTGDYYIIQQRNTNERNP